MVNVVSEVGGAVAATVGRLSAVGIRSTVVGRPVRERGGGVNREEREAYDCGERGYG